MTFACRRIGTISREEGWEEWVLPPAPRVKDLGGLLLELFTGGYCHVGPTSRVTLARTMVSNVFSCLLRGCVLIWSSSQHVLHVSHSRAMLE